MRLKITITPSRCDVCPSQMQIDVCSEKADEQSEQNLDMKADYQQARECNMHTQLQTSSWIIYPFSIWTYIIMCLFIYYAQVLADAEYFVHGSAGAINHVIAAPTLASLHLLFYCSCHMRQCVACFDLTSMHP